MAIQCMCIVAVLCEVMDPNANAKAQAVSVERETAIGLENAFCRILFDRADGTLRSIANVPLADECLKGGEPRHVPFRIYSDFTKEFELGDRLSEISRTVLSPGNCRLKDVRRTDRLGLVYEGDGLEVTLGIRLERESGVSDWSLQVKNIGGEPRQIAASFPFFGGVQPGADPHGNWATVMNQAGSTGLAWKHHGGVLGRGGELSMQWHAIWNPVSRSAFGVIVMDPDAKAKQFLLDEPNIEVNYFPPVTLEPGASLNLPAARVLVYRGDWRPAARVYRSWYAQAYPHAELPQWFRDSDGCEGRHFKKGGLGVKPDHGGQFVLDSFRDLPRAHLRIPFDNLEYAFYSRGSMLYNKHTDGDNIVREDLGGPEAMRDGFAGIHRLGLHATLYIEGYIVHQESDLAKSGRAERWSVMRKDGGITGPYTGQGFYHMCPGCVEWQDHLAATAARLLHETGANGIRLDSLGFYFLPCYNPAHQHATPFGYNEWMKQLLAKVRAAALTVNPDALLTTEAPVDWFGQWFHGALTQVYPRDLPLMRLAVGPYRPIVYSQGGPVWGSVSGLSGGRSCWEADLEPLEGNWLCARYPVHRALTEGEVADTDPIASDPQIVTRQFQGKGYWAVVAVRPACTDPCAWPAYTGLSTERREYTVALHGMGSASTVALCDIETLTWKPIEVERKDNAILLRLNTNWALVIVSGPDGPVVVDPGPLPAVHPGDSAVLHLAAVASGQERGRRLTVTVDAPGLQMSSDPITVPGETAIAVPSDALPGLYAVRLCGAHVLGGKRFLKVE